MTGAQSQTEGSKFHALEILSVVEAPFPGSSSIGCRVRYDVEALRVVKARDLRHKISRNQIVQFCLMTWKTLRTRRRDVQGTELD